MGTIRDLFVQIETFVLFFACVTVKNRLPVPLPLEHGIKREESLKRQAWLQYRSWSRITSGVLLSVIGAVQYGTSKVFYKIVPHFDTEGLRQYIHQVMARNTAKVALSPCFSGIEQSHGLYSNA